MQEYTKRIFEWPDWRVMLGLALTIILTIALVLTIYCIRGHCI